MHAPGARGSGGEGDPLARQLAPQAPDAALLAQRLTDGDLREARVAGLCGGLRALEEGGQHLLHDQLGDQLDQREECHGHESGLWRVSSN